MSEQEPIRAPLAELKVDLAPGRDLWAGIAARLDDPEEREHFDLTEELGAELRALRRDAAPAQDLWTRIAARIEDPALRDHCDLPEPLLTELRELPREAVPARELWTGIAARIDAQNEGRQLRRRRAPWLAAAASLAASLVVVFGIVVERDASPEVAATKTPLRPSAEVFAATIGHVRQGGLGGEEAAALQRASYRPISREERALVRANLKIVNTAEAQIEKAMAADSDDAAYLQALLDSARQHQQGLRAALADRP